MAEAEWAGTVADLQRHSSGCARTDLLALVVGVQLFLQPTRAAMLARSWVANYLASPIAPTPSGSFCSLLTAIVRGTTHECDLGLVVHETYDARQPLGYELLLFPRAYNLALSRALLVSMLAHATIEACGLLLDPRGGEPVPFLYAVESGALGQLEVHHFQANALLHYVYDPAYFVVLACHVWCAALVALNLPLHDTRLSDGLVQEIFSPVAGALRELASHTEGEDLRDELINSANIFDAPVIGLAQALAAFTERKIAWDAEIQRRQQLLRQVMERREPPRRYASEYDPAWLATDLYSAYPTKLGARPATQSSDHRATVS